MSSTPTVMASWTSASSRRSARGAHGDDELEAELRAAFNVYERRRWGDPDWQKEARGVIEEVVEVRRRRGAAAGIWAGGPSVPGCVPVVTAEREKAAWRSGRGEGQEGEGREWIRLVGRGRGWKGGLLVLFDYSLETNGTKTFLFILVSLFGTLVPNKLTKV
jgi:hypothetical protein